MYIQNSELADLLKFKTYKVLHESVGVSGYAGPLINMYLKYTYGAPTVSSRRVRGPNDCCFVEMKILQALLIYLLVELYGVCVNVRVCVSTIAEK